MGDELNAKQLQAAQLIGTGMDFDEVAKKVGVSGETLRKWRTNGTKEAMSAAIRDATDKWLDEIAGAASKALAGLLVNPDPSIRARGVELAMSRRQAIERRELREKQLEIERKKVEQDAQLGEQIKERIVILPAKEIPQDG